MTCVHYGSAIVCFSNRGESRGPITVQSSDVSRSWTRREYTLRHRMQRILERKAVRSGSPMDGLADFDDWDEAREEGESLGFWDWSGWGLGFNVTLREFIGDIWDELLCTDPEFMEVTP